MTLEEREFGARMFSALANPSRLKILEILSERPACVSEIARAAGLKQSITSQHLSALLGAGAVVYEPSGNQRIYRLRGPRIARVLDLMTEFHEVHVASLRELAMRYAQ